MSTANEIWLAGERLDLDEDTALLPSFQANDRTKPDTIQSDYSPEFSVPATAKNHRLLKHAVSSLPDSGAAYQRVPCVLTSGGVETLPLGILYIKGYSEGRIQLQLFGGNLRLVEALGEKKLSDLDLSRFNHYWTPEEVAAGLPYAHWKAQGWGYEVYDRGKPVDFNLLNPYDLYPSCSGNLIWQQILTDAGFTADDLLAEPLFASLNVPAPNPYQFPQDFRDARRLQAGYFYTGSDGLLHQAEFAPEKVNFSFTERKPYHLPDATTGAKYFAGEYTADTLGYYDLAGKITLYFGCRQGKPVYYGEVSCKVLIYINGAPVQDKDGNEVGKEELRIKGYQTHTFTPKLSRFLLKPGDRVSLWWQGDEWPDGPFKPSDMYWQIGPFGSQTLLKNGLRLANEAVFQIDLLAEFPQGGLVRLQDWLPDVTQLNFLKSFMLKLGLTIQVDAYEPHLHLSAGNQTLKNIPLARNWTNKLDAYAQPGRTPERDLAYRLGEYGQLSTLRWAEDERVTPGYGDGQISILDETLAREYEIATLPFAATLPSPNAPNLLQILNFEQADFTQDPPTYSSVTAKPRIVLRRPDGEITAQLIMVPEVGAEGQDGYTPPTLQTVTTTPSYFAGAGLSLMLNDTVLTEYWADARACVDEARVITERFRLTPADVQGLDFSIPVWVGSFGDFFLVSKVSEYDARRSTEVQLVRLNAAHLPPPAMPEGEGVEFWPGEFFWAEWY